MEDGTGAGSVRKWVKDAYCPALPHLHSAQLQLKGSHSPSPPFRVSPVYISTDLASSVVSFQMNSALC